MRNSAIFDPVAHWPEWTDVLGQKYAAGDHVAYASVSGKSPQMVIARVVRINRVNSQNKEIMLNEGTWSSPQLVPSCTVTVIPVIDARGFYRSNAKWDPVTRTRVPFAEAKPVTLQLPNNIIKVDWTPPEDNA